MTGPLAPLDRRAFLQIAGVGGGAGLAAPLTAAVTRAHAPPLQVRVPGGMLSVMPLRDNAVRIRLSPDGAAAPASQFLLPAGMPRSQVRRTKGASTLSLARLTCSLDEATGNLTFTDARGREILRAPAGRAAPATVGGQPTLAVEQTFAGPAGEALFGGGQFQDGFLDIKRLPRRMTQVNTQVSLPFFVSSAGYGVLWHNYGLTDLNPLPQSVALPKAAAAGAGREETVTTAAGSSTQRRQDNVFEGSFETTHAGRHALMLDVGSEMATRHHLEIDGVVLVDFANRWLPPTTSLFADLAPGRHRVRVIGDAQNAPVLFFGPAQDDTVLRSPVAEALDYVVVAGDDGADIVATYRQLTGTAPMPPRWAFGYVHSRERYHTQEELLSNAREFRQRRLPIDIIVQDWEYWGKHGWNAMVFDRDRYPDPAAMVRDLHALDMKLMLSVWPKVGLDTELGKQMTAHGYYVAGTEWIDFFNREAAAFYWKNERDKLLSLGIDCFWQDAVEPENDALAGRTTAAGPGDAVRNIYPLQVARTVYEGQRRDAPRKRVLTLIRSAAPAQQRYGTITWSGDVGNDWDTLTRQVAAGLNFAAAGMPYWTVDAGGFFRPGAGQYTDPAYQERLIRWFQFATFLPMQRVHGYQTDTEFWRYGPKVEGLARALIDLRYRLLPYIYSEAALVTHRDSSMMRPLVMDFPHDRRAMAQRHAYLFGHAFHVAPVLAPDVAEWPVYLPEAAGGWHDFWTGERRAGGTEHRVAATIDRIPLHLRAGSIVPLGPVAQSTVQATNAALELRLYPGADGRFSLYEDDGTSYDYEEGRFAWVDFAWNNRDRTLSISAPRGPGGGTVQLRRLHIVVSGEQTVRDVTYAGRAMTVMLGRR
jgi:alpha-D-xyloside xylohydrolase